MRKTVRERERLQEKQTDRGRPRVRQRGIEWERQRVTEGVQNERGREGRQREREKKKTETARWIHCQVQCIFFSSNWCKVIARM